MMSLLDCAIRDAELVTARQATRNRADRTRATLRKLPVENRMRVSLRLAAGHALGSTIPCAVGVDFFELSPLDWEPSAQRRVYIGRANLAVDVFSTQACRNPVSLVPRSRAK